MSYILQVRRLDLEDLDRRQYASSSTYMRIPSFQANKDNHLF